MKEWAIQWIRQLELTKQEKVRLVLIGSMAMLLGVALLIWDNQPLSGILQRNIYGDGDRQELLQVEVRGSDIEAEIEVDVLIREEVYEEIELQEAWEACIAALDIAVLGANESADCVYYDLNLTEQIDGIPIVIAWSWEPYELLNTEGEIQQDAIATEGSVLSLEAVLTYGTEEVIYQKTLCIYPEILGEEELLVTQLLEEIERIQGETSEDSSFELPATLNAYDLTWYGQPTYRGITVLMLGAIVILLLLISKREDKKQQEEERRAQMERDYPEIIHTFSLYIGAGMTAKNVWKKIVLEQEEKGEVRYIHMEMKRTHLEMVNGISEVDCYEAFGRRCGSRCYQRMGLLLSQNVRKGTKGLTALLEQEAIEAFDIRKRRARQDGEEAGTKLLMPMFLMLAVVLVIVVVPAFVSIQI